MQQTPVAFLVIMASVTLNIASAQEKANDNQAIQGTWQVDSAIFKGKPSKTEGWIWALGKSHVIYSFEAKDEYILDPEKNPKWIDVISVREGREPTRLYGIYSLQGDTLMLCLGFAKENRPTKFESPEGSGVSLITLKRVSKKIKEWPEPKKTFGTRAEPKFIKGGDRKIDALVLKTGVKDVKAPILTITGRDIDFVCTLAFSPDGSLLASGSASKGVTLWDVKTGKPAGYLQGHARDISSVVFSRDGKVLATSSYDMTIDLWDLPAERHIRTIFPRKGSISAIALSPDGKTLASASSSNPPIRFWELSNGKQIGATADNAAKVYSIAFSRDGHVLLSACEDKTITFWEVKTGKQIETLSAHSDLVSCVAVSADGKLFASSSRDKTIKLWNFETRKVIATLEGHSDWVRWVTFSPDGKTLASASFDQSVKLWDVERKKQIGTLSGHKGFVAAVAFSPDGRTLASGGWDYRINLWTIQTPD